MVDFLPHSLARSWKQEHTRCLRFSSSSFFLVSFLSFACAFHRSNANYTFSFPSSPPASPFLVLPDKAEQQIIDNLLQFFWFIVALNLWRLVDFLNILFFFHTFRCAILNAAKAELKIENFKFQRSQHSCF